MSHYTDGSDVALEKLGASKWRELIRAGSLGKDSIARLRCAPRPSGGQLFDAGREVAGLERGTQALLKETGGTIHEVNISNTIKSLLGTLRRKPEALEALQGQLKGKLLAPMGGGFVAQPAQDMFHYPQIYTTPQSSPLTNPVSFGYDDSPRAAIALARRHEVDELRAVAHKPKRYFGVPSDSVFKTYVPPTDTNDRIITRVKNVGRKLLERAYDNPDITRLLGGERNIERLHAHLGPRNMVQSGQHAAPFPILQESSNVAMLRPDVAEVWKRFRVGEQTALGPHGFQYGQAPSPQTSHNIQRAFNRGQFSPPEMPNARPPF